MGDWLASIQDKSAELEIFKFFLNIMLLLITWTLGKWFMDKWDQYTKKRNDEREKAIKEREIERDIANEERKRIREISRDLREQFHHLYGAFKSNVRLWKIAGKPTNTSNHSELIEQAVKAEGMVEALLSDIATLKVLDEDEVTTLGLYRQGYQTIRQAMTKDNRADKVPSTFDTDPYHLFNDVATQVSRIVVEIREEPTPEVARRNFDGVMDVRSDVWDEAIKCMKNRKKWKELIATATEKRKENLVKKKI